MADHPTAALTPEELAMQAFPNGCIRGRTLKLTDAVMEDIRMATADAIRQHSEAQRAEIERLTDALDDVQTAYCNHVTQQPDANAIAQSVADYGSAEAAVKGLHDFQLRVHRTMIDHFKARATTAEAALADLPRLIAVVGKLTGTPMDDPAGYGLDDCTAMLEEHEAAVAGIGWQIGLTGETERADRAEGRAADYHRALDASLERERLLREALSKALDAADEVARAKGRLASVRGASDQKRRNMEEWVQRSTAALDAALSFARSALQPQETADVR